MDRYRSGCASAKRTDWSQSRNTMSRFTTWGGSTRSHGFFRIFSFSTATSSIRRNVR